MILPQSLGIKPLVNQYTTPPPLSFIFNNFGIFGTLDPQFSPTNQFQIADQISWSHGKHTIRAGFEVERTQWNLVFGGLGQGWMFMGSFSNLLAGDTPGNLLFCLFCVRSGADGIIHAYRLPNMNAFTQDDWKVSSKLTVNLGVRWEYNGTLSDKNGNLTNTWLSQAGSQLAGAECTSRCRGKLRGVCGAQQFRYQNLGRRTERCFGFRQIASHPG